jgi:enamine deaminase RidA (YjgF/YER057c/UK114 family)
MVGAEARLRELNIRLPPSPTPFGAYVEIVQTGDLLFLSGMLPIENQKPKFLGRIGKELDGAAGREAARMTALNALALAREHLGSLDKVTRVVKLGVYIATSGDFLDQPGIADGASELLRDIFGADKLPVRLVMGVASLPMGMPIELEVILETKPR